MTHRAGRRRWGYAAVEVLRNVLPALPGARTERATGAPEGWARQGAGQRAGRSSRAAAARAPRNGGRWATIWRWNRGCGTLWRFGETATGNPGLGVFCASTDLDLGRRLIAYLERGRYVASLVSRNDSSSRAMAPSVTKAVLCGTPRGLGKSIDEPGSCSLRRQDPSMGHCSAPVAESVLLASSSLEQARIVVPHSCGPRLGEDGYRYQDSGQRVVGHAPRPVNTSGACRQ